MTTRLPTLNTARADSGYGVAVKMARVAIKMTHPNAALRDKLHSFQAEDTDTLIASSQALTTHFATVATVNYRKDAP